MNTARESERLNEILDCLWRDPATATAIAKNSLDRLAWQELCVLAAWDAAATYGPLGGRLQIAETNFSVLDQWGGPTFAGIVVRSFEPQPNELISYTDCQLRSVGKSGFRRNDAPVNHQVSELVVALEQIRDHLDSVLLRSGDERISRNFQTRIGIRFGRRPFSTTGRLVSSIENRSLSNHGGEMLIAFEGIDGAGKGTQASLFVERVRRQGYTVSVFSFPVYGSNAFGIAVGDYLNGKYGTVDDVDPHLSALLYAGDRFASREQLLQASADRDIVVCDRYVASNLAHQAAKLPENEWPKFLSWLCEIEYSIYRLPRPNLVFLLDLPVGHASDLISRKRARSYTDLKADIHEQDLSYLARCADVYRYLAQEHIEGPTTIWQAIQCVEADSSIRPAEAIAEEIWERGRLPLPSNRLIRTES